MRELAHTCHQRAMGPCPMSRKGLISPTMSLAASPEVELGRSFLQVWKVKKKVSLGLPSTQINGVLQGKKKKKAPRTGTWKQSVRKVLLLSPSNLSQALPAWSESHRKPESTGIDTLMWTHRTASRGAEQVGKGQREGLRGQTGDVLQRKANFPLRNLW